MYANMADLETFRKNVVSDGRSYSDETFAKAVKIINSTKKGISVTPENKEKFEMLATQLKDLKAVAQVEDVSLFDLTLCFRCNSTMLRMSCWIR